MKEWSVIVQNQDLNVRVDETGTCKVIDTQEFEFDNKKEAFKKFGEMFTEYYAKSYDWKAHSFSAMKFYHSDTDNQDEDDVLTYVLLYFDGDEYEPDDSEKDHALLDKYIKIAD